jgi:hypothetical protein
MTWSLLKRDSDIGSKIDKIIAELSNANGLQGIIKIIRRHGIR